METVGCQNIQCHVRGDHLDRMMKIAEEFAFVEVLLYDPERLGVADM